MADPVNIEVIFPDPIIRDIEIAGSGTGTPGASGYSGFSGSGGGASGYSGYSGGGSSTITRTHISESATITLPLGDGIDYDTTATGTLTTIAFSGSPSSTYPSAALLRIVVGAGGPYTLTVPSCRRVGEAGSTTTSLTFAASANTEISSISQPSGPASAIEYWMADSVEPPGTSGYSGYSGAGLSGF